MEQLTIKNTLNKPIGIDLYPAKRSPKAIIQLATATAVDKRLYSFFAAYLAKKNYTVLVAGYYGVGLTPDALKKEKDYAMSRSTNQALD